MGESLTKGSRSDVEIVGNGDLGKTKNFPNLNKSILVCEPWKANSSVGRLPPEILTDFETVWLSDGERYWSDLIRRSCSLA